MAERTTLHHVGAALDAVTAHTLAVEQVHRQAAQDAHDANAGGHTQPYEAAHEQPATSRSTP